MERQGERLSHYDVQELLKDLDFGGYVFDVREEDVVAVDGFQHDVAVEMQQAYLP